VRDVRRVKNARDTSPERSSRAQESSLS
jgi:hypothetical protein